MFQTSRNTTIDLKQTAQVHGGLKAYERAKADSLTKLDFEPWLIGRTAEFKNWFGDWGMLLAIAFSKKSQSLTLMEQSSNMRKAQF